MRGLMQDRPLLISGLVDYAADYHGAARIVSRNPDGSMRLSDWRTIRRRAKRLAVALRTLGLGVGDRVATLAWNGFRHLELYFGVTGSGSILHTVNPRLFPEQLTYIIDHAEDSYVFFDPVFVPLVEQLAPSLPHVKGYVALCERAEMPAVKVEKLLCYEELLAAADEDYEWPALDENTASTLCYTSGTTGNPKGVLYAHRSTVLHSFCAVSTDVMRLSCRDTILAVVPLFHANAWGLPFAAAMCGAQIVLPGPKLDPASIFMLLRDQACNVAAGIPTIWLNFLAWVDANREKVDLTAIHLERVLSGGAAVPRSTIEAFERLFGTTVIHAWGMTETSPIATIGTLLPKHARLSRAQQIDVQLRQGRSLYGCEVKAVGPNGEDLPHDGVSVGELKVRGPWVLSGYFKGAGGAVMDKDGWFGTGDVASIDADGYVLLTDRLKDVIKSGGEWISSIEIENLAVGHPDVHEAAVIAVDHPTWQERPLLLVQCKPGCTPGRDEILSFLSGKIAKWWMPDDVVFVDSLPHTATGKLLKTRLREEYRGHLVQQRARA
jgi:fatty-acyl-CoA synthase